MTNTIHKPCCPRLLLLLLFFCLSIPQQAAAKTKSTVIADGAGLLSTDDTAELMETCDAVSARYHTSLYIISTNTIGEKDDYSHYLDTIITDKKSPENLIILFISVKEKEPFCAVRTGGSTREQITQERCSSLAKALEKGLRNGDAYTAIDHCADTIAEYFQTKPFTDFILFHPILQLLLCLAAAGITLFLAAANPLPKQKFHRLDYVSKDQSGQLGHLDTLVRTTIQKKTQL